MIWVADALEQDYFQSHLQKVIDKLELSETAVNIFVAENPSQALKSSQFPCSTQAEQKINSLLKKSGHSMSFREEGEDYVFIKVRDFMKEEQRALKGLYAHELMHVLHRRQGTEKKIEKAAFNSVKDYIHQLSQLTSTERARKIMVSVMKTAVFALKDLLVNKSLLELSFRQPLESYYRHLLVKADYCPMPDFYGREEELDEIVEAIEFELELLPSWLPFEQAGRASEDLIKEKIEECYELNIEQVAQHIHNLAEEFQEAEEELGGSPKKEECQQFFAMVYNTVETILEEKNEEIGISEIS